MLQKLLATVQAKHSPTCRCCNALQALAFFPAGMACLEVETGQFIQSRWPRAEGRSQRITCASPCNTSEALCQQLGHRRVHTLLGMKHIPNNFVTLYMGLLLVLLQTRTSSGWRVRSSFQTGKYELGATKST